MSKKKKIILIVAIILILIFIVSMIIINSISSRKKLMEYEVEEIAEIEYQYFLLYENEKYGVIDTKGNTIIESKFDQIIIPNPKVPVFVCSVDGNEKNTILNEKNEEIFTIYDNVEAIQLQGLITALPYEKNVLKYEVNGQYGLIDLEGNRIIKAIYEEINGLKYKEGELIAKSEGKYGVININGAEMLDFEYDDIEADKYYVEGKGYTESGYIVMKTTEEGYRYGYVKKNGDKILETEYTNVKRVTDIEGDIVYLIASSNGQYGFLKEKEVLIDFKYQGIDYNDANNLLVINRGTKYGVFTLNGQEIVPIDYKTVQFNGIYIYAKTGSDIKYFTNTGEEVTTGYTSLQPVNDNKYYIAIDGNGLYGIANSEQKSLVENNYVYIEYLFDDYFSAYKNGSGLGIINSNGEVIVDFKYTIINKISDTKLIKAADMSNDVIEIYSNNIEKIAELDNAVLDIKDTYLKLYNSDKNIYLNMEGQEIDEVSALESTQEAPDTIGEYVKEYFGYAQVYYMVEENESLEKTEE